MTRKIDRASILKLGGAAGIATLIESLASVEQSAASPRNPMNLTLTTTKTKGSGLYYTVIIDKNRTTIPSYADLIMQTHVSSLGITVTGNEWNINNPTGRVTDKWITIYVSSKQSP